MHSSFSFPKVLALIVLVCLTSAVQAAQLPSRENNTFMACGHGFSSYLDGDGQVWNSGLNNYDQLGCGGSIGYTSVPVKVSGATPATAIATGDSFEIALVNGVPMYWGHGLAGLPDSNVAVAIPGDTIAKAVTCAGNHALFLNADGTMSQINGTSTTIVAVTGPTHVIQIGSAAGCDMYLTDDHVLHALDGSDAYGALGLGTVTSITSPATILSNVVNFSLADHHAMALSGTGQGFSWGKASQNGLGGTSDQTTPAPITSVTHIRQMVCAGSNSFILGSDGQNWGAGENQAGSLGVGNTTPQSAFTLLPVTAATGLAGADRHTLIQGSFANYIAGTVFGAGDNSHGSLSMGNFVSTTYPLPTTFGETSVQSMLSAGDGDSFTLYRGGQIRSVGKNDHGQLGYSTGGSDTTTDAPITGVPIFVWVSAGDGFTGAVDINGHAWFFGTGADGELGQNSTSDSAVPVMAPLDNVVALALGSGHVIAQLKDGTSVAVWGRNNHYQLGLGDTTNRLVPTTLTLSSAPLSVSAGGDHSTFVLQSGVPQCCGSNADGECGQGTSVDVQVPTSISSLSSIIGSASGTTHTWFLDATNHIYHTGSNTFGEAMDGTTSGHLSPVLVGSGAMNIWVGNHTSFWLDQYNDITASGWNGSGILTNGTTSNTSTGVMALLWADLMAIGKHHLISAFDGFVTTGGGNTHGELDTGNTSPASSGAFAQFPSYEVNNNTSLAAGLTFSMQVDELGDLYGYGYGLDGQIGNGGFSQSWIGYISAYNIMQTSAGAHHAIEVDSFGNSFAQGAGNRGQLGNGLTSQQLYPSFVTLPLPALKSFCGNNCTYWLLDDFTLAVAGANSHGALGTGDRVDVLTPLVVLTHVIDVHPGDGFVWVVKDDGSTMACGRNDLQQLGFSSGGADVLTFTAIPSLSNVMAGSAGGSASVAVKGDGTPFTFGSSTLGALGLGSVTTSAPAQMFLSDGVTPVSNITAASMGNGFLALNQGPGTLLMSGDDSFNQFNDSTYTQKNFVQAVTLTAPLTFFSAGGSHLLNQLADGNTENLGSDVFGELGNNTTYSPPPPAPSSFWATLNGTTEIDLTWASTGTPANFEIDQSTDGGTTWSFLTSSAGTSTSYNLTGLPSGVTYNFRIESLNPGAASAWVYSSAVQTPFVAPIAPSDLTVTAGTPGSLTLNWTNNGGDATSLLVQEQNSDGSFTTIATLSPSVTSYTLYGLTSGVPLTFVVVGSNPVGTAATSVSTPVASLPEYRYAVVDLGTNFHPRFIANNGVITGSDASGNLARLVPGGTVTELKVSGVPFPVPSAEVALTSTQLGYSVNNNGDVVSSIQQSFNVTAGLYWPSSSNDTTPVVNPDLETDSSYGSAYNDHRSYVSYTAIKDDGTIYGTQLAEAVGYLYTSTTNTSAPYGGGDYIYPGGVGPAGLPDDTAFDLTWLINVFEYDYNYDGFQGAITELGTAPPPVVGSTYQATNAYPLIAKTGLLVTKHTSVTMGSVSTVCNLDDTGTFEANGVALPFQPIRANNSGIVVGGDYGDISSPSSATNLHWWDASTNVSHTLSTNEGDQILDINSRTILPVGMVLPTGMGTPLPDPQMLGQLGGSNVLLERAKDATNTPTGDFEEHFISLLIDRSGPWSMYGALGINDMGAIVGSAGYNPPAPGDTTPAGYHAVMLCPMDVIEDTNGNNLGDASDKRLDYVRFGLWDNAFDPSGNVLDGNAEYSNFVGSDSRRFYLRVYDPTATATTVTMHWFTQHADGSPEDHPGFGAQSGTDTVTLTETGTNTGVFVSKALMLVSDATDQAQPTNTGLTGGTDAALGEPNHRLRLAKLGDRMCFSYTPGKSGSVPTTCGVPVFVTSATLDPVKTITIHLVNYSDTHKGIPPLSDDLIERIKYILWTRYAVTGVKVKFVTTDTINLPSGSLTDLTAVQSFLPLVVGGSLTPSAEQTGLINLISSTPVSVSSPDVIYCLLVRGLTGGPGGMAGGGNAFSDSFNPVPIAKNICFIGTDAGGYYTSAHEVGHLLLNQTPSDITSSSAGHYSGAQSLQNLMKGGFLSTSFTTPTLSVTDSKRLWADTTVHADQITKLRSSRFAK